MIPGEVISMSKYYWERGDSAVAYIDTAGKLSARLQTSCANVNHKKYTFYGLQKLYSTAEELCDLCHLVNRLNLNDPRQAQERAIALQKARAKLDYLVHLMSRTTDRIDFSEGVLFEISTLMEKEDKLLSGLQKSDAERRKRLR